MRRLAFLVRPGWIALVLVVVAFAWVCFTQLAPWQLGKNGTTEARNARISASFDQEPVAMSTVVPPGSAPAREQEWRRVSAMGQYVATEQVLARLRTVEGKPAYEVLTPFRTTDGVAVLVDRGYVRPVTGTQAPRVPEPPAGQVTLTGRVRLDEQADDARPVETVDGVRQVYEVNATTVGAAIGVELQPGYLQLGDGAPGVLGVLPLPQLDSGPYLSYGLQWLAFGLMAPLGLAYFVRAELRERRRDLESHDDEVPELIPATGSAPDAPTPEPLTGEAKMLDRYGRRR